MGISQSGRFLRHFIYEGFNADEQGKQAIDAMFVSVEPPPPAVTVTSKLCDAQTARLPTVQVTTPAACVQPALAETKVELAGRLSLTATPVAGAGPLFVAVRW